MRLAPINVYQDLNRLLTTNFPIVAGCIAFKSFNKKYWRQNLHIPSKVLEESVFISEKEYNVLTKRIE